jgi:uncharacterized protein YggE
MKYVTSTILFVMLFASFVSYSQDSLVHDNRMTVYGTSTIDVPADMAKLTFTVKGFASTLQGAVGIARKKVSDITGELLSQGLKQTNLFTSSFTSGDNYEGKAFLSSSRDYRAQIDVVVTIDSLDMLETVVSTLTKGALERLSDISFSLKGDSAMKLETRRLAVENAQIKANIIAKQLGVEVGKALSVDELLSTGDGDFYISDPNRLIMLQVGVVRTSGGSYYAQRFNVRSGVRIVFEISNRANGK